MQNNHFKIVFILLITLIIVTNKVYAEVQSYDATISGVDTPTIYDVDIKWDSMKFTFVEKEKYKYNESNHTYNRIIEKYWSSDDNNIAIKNKSLKEVNVSLKFNTLNTNVKGSFTKNNFNIKSLEEHNTKLNLTGIIDNSYHEYRTIGEISIVVS